MFIYTIISFIAHVDLQLINAFSQGLRIITSSCSPADQYKDRTNQNLLYVQRGKGRRNEGEGGYFKRETTGDQRKIR